MMFLRVRSYSLFIAVLISPFVRADNEAPPAPVLTLEELVRSTVAQSPEIRFYEAQIDIAQAESRSAGLLSNPVVSSDVGPMRAQDLDGNLTGEGVAWSVSVMQPFEWPGRLGLRKAIANRDIALARLGLERFRASLAARVRSLAFGLFAAQEKAMAAAEVAERLRELKEVLVQRDPAGVTPLLETRVIESSELTAQRQAADLALALESGLLELNALRGGTQAGAFTIPPAKLEFRPAGDRAWLMALARTNNFELRLRAVELEQQGFRVDLAKNE
ncbi:MAG: TolC family protein [Verrucomicrobiae bacterium]|nr:TolC family protein [Verrucomicrobiae bacterium]